MAKKTENGSSPEWKPSTADVNRLREEIQEPRYPFGVLEQIDDTLTYRKLNSWEQTGLISPFRKTDKTGWRKFSFYEAVQLLMINDLKQVGLTAETIRKVLFKLTSNLLGIPWLEIFLVGSVRGGRYVFLVDKSGEITTPMKDEAILDVLRPDNINGPSVVCPLYYYVRRLLNLIRPEVSSSAPSKPRDLNEKDKEVLLTAAGESWEKIRFVKADGFVKTLRNAEQGKKKSNVMKVLKSLRSQDYSEIVVTMCDGQVVRLKATDLLDKP